MQAQKKTTPEPTRPDLKHDTMEYSASTDGDDILDADKVSIEEVEAEEITAEELELLRKDDVSDQAAALNSAQTDSEADADNFLSAMENEDVFEENQPEESEDERS